MILCMYDCLQYSPVYNIVQLCSFKNIIVFKSQETVCLLCPFHPLFCACIAVTRPSLSWVCPVDLPLLSPPPRLRGDVSPPRAPPSLPLYKAALIILWGKNNIKQPCDIGTKLLQFQSICKKRFKSKGQSIIVSCMCSIPWPCTKINEIIYFCTAVTMYCDVFLDKLRGPTNEYNESLYSSVKMGATIWSEPASRDVCTSYRTWYLFRTCIFPWHLMAALFSIIHRLYVILKPLEQPIPKGQHESTKHPAKADFRISFKAASKWWLSN